MLNDSYYYNATVRKTVAVFGSLFNNIYTGKVISGQLSNVIRVPLAYGPRERFLVRIRTADNSENADVAIKLPRMSFEITSLSYDSTVKLNKNNYQKFPVEGTTDSVLKVYQSIPYILGLQLNIIADNQDLALQVMEQIIPLFAPDYTVTVKDMEGPGTRTDLPFTLSGVTMQDDYEGDFETGRRTIIYTLDFNVKIKFIGSTTANDSKVIKSVTVNLPNGGPCDVNNAPVTSVTTSLGDPINDTPDNYTVVTTYGFD